MLGCCGLHWFPVRSYVVPQRAMSQVIGAQVSASQLLDERNHDLCHQRFVCVYQEQEKDECKGWKY